MRRREFLKALLAIGVVPSLSLPAQPQPKPETPCFPSDNYFVMGLEGEIKKFRLMVICIKPVKCYVEVSKAYSLRWIRLKQKVVINEFNEIRNLHSRYMRLVFEDAPKGELITAYVQGLYPGYIFTLHDRRVQ